MFLEGLNDSLREGSPTRLSGGLGRVPYLEEHSVPNGYLNGVPPVNAPANERTPPPNRRLPRLPPWAR